MLYIITHFYSLHLVLSAIFHPAIEFIDNKWHNIITTMINNIDKPITGHDNINGYIWVFDDEIPSNIFVIKAPTGTAANEDIIN